MLYIPLRSDKTELAKKERERIDFLYIPLRSDKT